MVTIICGLVINLQNVEVLFGIYNVSFRGFILRACFATQKADQNAYFKGGGGMYEKIDPITLEVIHHRLESITEEAEEVIRLNTGLTKI